MRKAPYDVRNARDEIDALIRLLDAVRAAVIGMKHDELAAGDYSEGIGWLLIEIAARLRQTEEALGTFQE